MTTRPLAPPPERPSCFWKVFAGVALAAVVGIVVAFLALGRIHGIQKADAKKLNSVSAKADAATAKADKATADASAAMAGEQANAGLIQSIRQALASAEANGVVTQAQVAAIAAQVRAQQAAKAGAQVGIARPGVPGSQAGGGTSFTPGVRGSAIRPVVSTTPPPHSSSTANCLLTVQSQPLTLDGTLCSPKA